MLPPQIGRFPNSETPLRQSRHANSTLDVQTDFGANLKPIKRQDGSVSELFPGSLRELFSLDSKDISLLHGPNEAC